MIDQRDNDHLAKKLGYENMAQVRAEREAQEKEAAIARAEAKAIQEAVRAEEEAKVREINDALTSGRLIVRINGRHY